MSVKLLPHQIKVLEETQKRNRVAYYLDMGLGKTYVGSEKAISLHKNILVICQKSKVDDWYQHFRENYGSKPTCCNTCDLTKVKEKDLKEFLKTSLRIQNKPGAWNFSAWIINYDLAFRRKELLNLKDFTLMLDESSLISNPNSKRTKFIMKLNPVNVILLSGTPVSGKYEQCLSQMNLLGWNISQTTFERLYCIKDFITGWNGQPLLSPAGYPLKQIVDYKNVEHLKGKMRDYGCVFMKTEEVIDLPEQRFINVKIEPNKAYKKFLKDSIVTIDDVELIGDMPLKRLLYCRMLSSAYNEDKLQKLSDLIDSTNDRLIIFYNFDIELEAIKKIIPSDRPISYINGSIKDTTAYENNSNSITLCQYQSASMGHNLQKADKIIYFSPTLSSDLYEQSKKRIHRIGQKNNCLYYKLVSGIEWHIYSVLDTKRDYTNALFEDFENDI